MAYMEPMAEDFAIFYFLPNFLSQVVVVVGFQMVTIATSDSRRVNHGTMLISLARKMEEPSSVSPARKSTSS